MSRRTLSYSALVVPLAIGALVSGCSEGDAGDTVSGSAVPSDQLAQLFHTVSYDYDTYRSGVELEEISDAVVTAELLELRRGPQNVAQVEGQEVVFDNVTASFRVIEDLGQTPVGSDVIDVLLPATPQTDALLDATPEGEVASTGRVVLYLTSYLPDETLPLGQRPDESIPLFVPVSPQGFILETQEGSAAALEGGTIFRDVPLEEFYPSDSPLPEFD